MKTNKPQAHPAEKQKPRPTHREGVEAATNWLPVPVSWPSRPAWNNPQSVKIRQPPPWQRPGLTM